MGNCLGAAARVYQPNGAREALAPCVVLSCASAVVNRVNASYHAVSRYFVFIWLPARNLRAVAAT